jgi:glycosyltransferase involved in cell wall biosynthesis
MNKVSFAIAASSFSKPSETFIRDHAQSIAPGETVLISHEPPPESLAAYSALSGIDLGAALPAGGRIEKTVNTAKRFWRRYAHPVLPAGHHEKTVAFLKETKPAALMTEYGLIGVMMAKPARQAGVPLYVHFHGFDAAVVSKLPYWRTRYRKLFRDAAGVIGPSEFIVNKLAELGCPREKLYVCACGINPDLFSETQRLPLRLVAVGRFVPKKAPHVTVEAFAKIADDFPDARLDMIGDGPLKARCEKLIVKHGLEERVILHGAKSHAFVAEKMREASVYLQHSVTASYGDVEGMPVSILEAMACSLPVVSTRHSGIREAVEEGKTGFLVDEHDVNGMADAIAAMLCDPARAEAMGKAARLRVLERYTQQKSREKLRSIMGLSG